MKLGGPGGISFRRKAAASDQIEAHVIDWLAEQAASPGHGNVADSIAGELSDGIASKVLPLNANAGSQRELRKKLINHFFCYAAGKCRCEHRRGAYASYRAQRRAAGRDQPRRIRSVETDGHVPRWWFRQHIWLPAVEAAQLPAAVKLHGLRHAHGSWLGWGSGPAGSQ